MQKTKTGFTLIELMISVALMLVLVGAVVMVFNHAATVFTISEAKMSIYQNARAALELMARELTSADNAELASYAGNDYSGFEYLATSGGMLRFKTNTFWSNAGNKENGMAVIEYYLSGDVPNTNVRNLMRRVRKITVVNGASTLNEVSNGILGQYISKDADAFTIEFFDYKEGDDPPWKASTTKPGYDKLPSAVRITIKFCDKESRITRVLSRTVWIPKASS